MRGVFNYHVSKVDFHLNGYMTKPKHSNIMGFLLAVKKVWERVGFLLKVILVEDSTILHFFISKAICNYSMEKAIYSFEFELLKLMATLADS